ncbi:MULTISPECIES: hypothetical protein [Sphingomonadales]|jgi:hypothetical protein|uniref:Uncharacterized protein n=3 Tax=Alphaproteobacteria TaxID=28211 RepID=A0A8E0WP43_9SPHN|nr:MULTISPECIES: hypothetical protein [Sphingobium]EPR14810.1 hypothetical protein M527_27815 [Sphingobium indicum IP26]EQB18692.1 hypothetical protein RLDS_01890 [Sphingobium lactosutens DS20]KER34780.1 hypothetical protein AL00_19650 [Sphingobium indicum F2]TKW63897.1 MAG: hypothetical protein DI616_18950 [Paracoccus denitrificans]|tara:strand:- start:4839 stop:5042 length:204 start_codon:yes stop_codon:yes gene_type:complete
MSKPTIAEIDVEALLTKQRHDMMLAMPPKDGFCRFYGDYVPVGKKARFDGKLHTCVATERFEPDDED